MLEARDPKHRYLKEVNKAHSDWMRQETNLSLFEWIDSQDKYKTLPCVHYFSPNERNEYLVSIDNGLFKYRDGRKVDTSQSEAALEKSIPKGYGIIVVTPNGEVVVHDYKKGRLHHTSSTHGKPILTAGMAKIVKGELIELYVMSGHYMCEKSEYEEMIKFLIANNIGEINVKCSYLSVQESSKIKSFYYP